MNLELTADSLHMAALMAAVFVAFGIEAMTGFGSIVLALSFASLLFPIQDLIPVLVPLNLMLSGPLCLRHRRHINWAVLLKQILPGMALGTLAGLWLSNFLPAAWMLLLFALLIIWFAGRSVFKQQAQPLSQSAQSMLIAMAGITHGLFASGGPLLVYATARSGLQKSAFRATLLVVWFSLNSMMTVLLLIRGQIQPQAATLVMLVPAVLAGLWAGSLLHQRVDQQQFLQWVFRILLFTGTVLLAKSMHNLA